MNVLSLDICTAGLTIFWDLPVDGKLDQWFENTFFCNYYYVLLDECSLLLYLRCSQGYGFFPADTKGRERNHGTRWERAA